MWEGGSSVNPAPPALPTRADKAGPAGRPSLRRPCLPIESARAAYLAIEHTGNPYFASAELRGELVERDACRGENGSDGRRGEWRVGTGGQLSPAGWAEFRALRIELGTGRTFGCFGREEGLPVDAGSKPLR